MGAFYTVPKDPPSTHLITTEASGSSSLSALAAASQTFIVILQSKCRAPALARAPGDSTERGLTRSIDSWGAVSLRLGDHGVCERRWFPIFPAQASCNRNEEKPKLALLEFQIDPPSRVGIVFNGPLRASVRDQETPDRRHPTASDSVQTHAEIHPINSIRGALNVARRSHWSLMKSHKRSQAHYLWAGRL